MKLSNRRLLRLAILRTVVFVGFVCLAARPTLADGVNIVSDPGFELGTSNSYTFTTTPVPMGDAWFVTAGTGAICNVITQAVCGNAGPAHTGDQMAFLDWDGTLNTITQTLTTVVGQTYTISFWVYDQNANSFEATFGGSTFDTTDLASCVGSPSDYVLCTFNATTTSTSTVLAFSGERTVRGGILLDDVSVTAAPESPTWALTSVALLGLVVLRRRRSKISPAVGW